MADWISLFDGNSLAGWHAVPRLPVPRAPGDPAVDTSTENYHKAAQTSGKWTVEDGAICGRQDPPGSGFGGYLVSDGVYGDFELMFEARPDWPADTGVLVRAQTPPASASRIPATTIEQMTPEKRALLSQKASGEDFIGAWKWGEWNEFRLRVEGASPKLSSWIKRRADRHARHGDDAPSALRRRYGSKRCSA